jgi:UDP-glucose 4-epimerase
MGRTILVTGGAGFIGSNLARALVAGGERLRVLDDLSMGHRAYLAGTDHELIEGSLADPSAVERAVGGVDAIVHLAARADVTDSVRDPIGTFDANVTQTVGLLDAARRAGVGRFVFASSNAATGEHPPPAGETDLPHPISPYGASKLAGEAYCQAFAASYGIVTCAMRFANVYGPYALHKKSVVAAWMRASLEDRPIIVYGDGEQTRDFIHAGDLAAAIVTAIDAPAERVSGELFCLGTGQETSVNQLATTLGEVLGRTQEIDWQPPLPAEIRRNASDVRKAAEVLGFRAQWRRADCHGVPAAWFRAALADPQLAAIRPHAASGSE